MSTQQGQQALPQNRSMKYRRYDDPNQEDKPISGSGKSSDKLRP
jgi:hypothetical protein